MKTSYRCDGCVHQFEYCQKDPHTCIGYVATAAFIKRREAALKELL